MPQLINGQKTWRCRLEQEHWQNFTTNNPKVDVEYTASHFLGWNKVVPSGKHTVYVQDPAEQKIFKVVFRQQYEEVKGNFRGMRDLISLEEIENEFK